MTVYVGNLSYRATEDDLMQLFSDYGTVNRVSIPSERDNPDRKRGFAFVELNNEENEQNAIHALNDLVWMGRQLRVNQAPPRERRPRRPGYSNDFDRY